MKMLREGANENAKRGAGVQAKGEGDQPADENAKGRGDRILCESISSLLLSMCLKGLRE